MDTRTFRLYLIFLLTVILFKMLFLKEDSLSQLSNVKFMRLFDKQQFRDSMHESRKNEKWIVITTISLPTSAVKMLADKPGWRVVIVADQKTPIDWDFFNCEFLSLDRQKTLGYDLIGHMPFNSYTRKMIGYLFAIEHGAEWIYDTDDDNQPTGLGLKQFDIIPQIAGMAYGLIRATNDANEDRTISRLFNPYAFFGRPNMWPRGYPLEQLNVQNNEEHFRLCKSRKTPIIQQGLVNKDPDVDAIFRLVNAKNEKDGLNLEFNSHSPPILLEHGTFCPFNSQNTLFHRDAFWALFLPISVAFRVTDIWRSYFVQKLLHLTGNTIGFYPPNAKQMRNPHSYLADFQDETAIYNDAGRMVKYLTNWTCTQDTLEACMSELSTAFVKENFWKEDDVTMIEAWINSLKAIGYKFPLFQNSTAIESRQGDILASCRHAFLQFPTTTMEERNELTRKSFKELGEWCAETDSFVDTCVQSVNSSDAGIWGNLRRNTTLIITSNEAIGAWVGVLQRLHEPFFATVIFCGPVDSNTQLTAESIFPTTRPYSYIHVTEEEMNGGSRAYICTTKAIELRLQNIAGYMVMSDDTVYNFWNELDLSTFQLPTTINRDAGKWWGGSVSLEALDKSVAFIRNEIQVNANSPLAHAWRDYVVAVGGDGFDLLSERDVWASTNMYYLPKTNEAVFYELSNVFFDAKVFNDIAVPKLAAGFGWLTNYKRSPSLPKPKSDRFLNIWGGDRDIWEKKYHKDLLFLHPVKLSTVKTMPERQKYCEHIVRNFHQAIFNSTKTEAQLNAIYANVPAIISGPLGEMNDQSMTVDSHLQSTTEESKELSPNSITKDCCKKSPEINKACYEYCSFDNLNATTVIGMAMKKNRSCFLSMEGFSKILTCLSSNEDHSECCMKKKVHKTAAGAICLDFCKGTLVVDRITEMKYVPCMEAFDSIMGCFKDFMSSVLAGTNLS